MAEDEWVRAVEGQRNDRLAAERERDAHAARNRNATQAIVDAIGSVGPESVEDAALRIVARVRELEAERDEISGLLAKARAERDESRSSERAALVRINAAWADAYTAIRAREPLATGRVEDLPTVYGPGPTVQPTVYGYGDATAVVATLYGAAAEMATLDAAWGEVFRRHYDREIERARSDRARAGYSPIATVERFGRWARLRAAVREALDRHVRQELDR